MEKKSLIYEELLTQNYELLRQINELKKQLTESKCQSQKCEVLENASESEKKFKTAFYGIPESVSITDLNGTYIEISEGTTNLLGYNKEEIIGKTSIELNIWVYPEHRKVLVKELHENNAVDSLQTLFRKKDGTLVPALISANLMDLNGTPFILTAVKEISALKKIEQELIEAKEKAEESNRLKTEFFNNISHEIRTPMNGIIGFTDMLSDPDLTEGNRNNFIKIIQNSTFRLLKIIDSILEITSLETKQVKVSQSNFCLNELIIQVFYEYEKRIKDKGLLFYLKRSLSDEASMIYSDKEKLIKILEKILDNAVKYTHEGEIEIGYYTDNNSINIYIKDTGIGISSKKKNSIFEPFRQVDTSLSRQYGGLGVGLAIAYDYTKLLGGSISYESEEDNGTTMFIKLPYNTVDAKTEKNSINISDQNTKFLKNEYSILVVEDEEINYLLIEAILGDHPEAKYKCIHARNGQEALKILNENEDLDLVLMDLKMPIMDGYEATQKIRKIRSHIPIIAQTAYNSEQDKIRAFDSGCDDFISKPIDKDHFFRLINKYRLKENN